MSKPFVAILMGSDSDLDTMQVCIDTLDAFGIGREVNVLSAHRTPAATHAYVLMPTSAVAPCSLPPLAWPRTSPAPSRR